MGETPRIIRGVDNEPVVRTWSITQGTFDMDRPLNVEEFLDNTEIARYMKEDHTRVRFFTSELVGHSFRLCNPELERLSEKSKEISRAIADAVTINDHMSDAMVEEIVIKGAVQQGMGQLPVLLALDRLLQQAASNETIGRLAHDLRLRSVGTISRMYIQELDLGVPV